MNYVSFFQILHYLDTQNVLTNKENMNYRNSIFSAWISIYSKIGENYMLVYRNMYFFQIKLCSTWTMCYGTHNFSLFRFGYPSLFHYWPPMSYSSILIPWKILNYFVQCIWKSCFALLILINGATDWSNNTSIKQYIQMHWKTMYIFTYLRTH